jgi:hypothetical protein
VELVAGHFGAFFTSSDAPAPPFLMVHPRESVVDASAMRTVISLVTAVGLAASLIGCGSGPYCDRSSKCSQEPLKTEVQKKACTADLESAKTCKTQYEAWLNCQADREVCKADNTSDPVATFAYANAPCKPSKDAYTACVAGPDAGK